VVAVLALASAPAAAELSRGFRTRGRDSLGKRPVVVDGHAVGLDREIF
jgi:hypothetical protein